MHVQHQQRQALRGSVVLERLHEREAYATLAILRMDHQLLQLAAMARILPRRQRELYGAGADVVVGRDEQPPLAAAHCLEHLGPVVAGLLGGRHGRPARGRAAGDRVLQQLDQLAEELEAGRGGQFAYF